MKRSTTLLNTSMIGLTFVGLALSGYLLSQNSIIHARQILATCGQILSGITTHLHIFSTSYTDSIILLVMVISVSLTLAQIIRFSLPRAKNYYRPDLQSQAFLSLAQTISKHQIPEQSIVLLKTHQFTAYTTGTIRPRIVLSHSFVETASADEIEAVVLHELYHLRSHHVLYTCLLKIIQSLLFFIPLIHYLANRIKTEFELAADAYVIRKQHTTDHLRHSLALGLQVIDSSTPHFASTPLEQRIEAIITGLVSTQPKPGWQILSSAIVLFIMLALSVGIPGQIKADVSQPNPLACLDSAGCLPTENCHTSSQHSYTSPSAFPLSSHPH